MRRLSGLHGGWGMRMAHSAQEDQEGEGERRELWNFSAHTCGIALRSWKMYHSDFSRCRHSPHRGPGDGDFSNGGFSEVTLHLHPSFFSAFPFTFSISLCLITLIGTDTAMWTLGVILEFTCLADKSVSNWEVTWDPASPSRLNVPSQKAVAFDMDPSIGLHDANLNHYVAFMQSWHDIGTLGLTHSFMLGNNSGIF